MKKKAQRSINMKSSYLELNLMYCSTGLKAELSPELIWYKIAKRVLLTLAKYYHPEQRKSVDVRFLIVGIFT